MFGCRSAPPDGEVLRFGDIDVPACCTSLKRLSLLYSAATYVAVQKPNYIKATLHEAKILSQPLKSAAKMLLGDEEAGHEAVRAAVEAIAGQCSRLETISLAPRLAQMFSSQALYD